MTGARSQMNIRALRSDDVDMPEEHLLWSIDEPARRFDSVSTIPTTGGVGSLRGSPMALVADGVLRVSADRTRGPAAADFGDDLANIIGGSLP